MREALSLLDDPEAAPVALQLRLAIEEAEGLNSPRLPSRTAGGFASEGDGTL